MKRPGIFLLFMIGLVQACNPGAGRSAEDFLKYDPNQYERVSIHYVQEGQGDTTLVFIHGWNIDHTYWNDIVPSVSKNYRILSLDLAGHGDSGKDRLHWTAESFGRDISAIIAKEKLKHVILIGHSLGGNVALEVLRIDPKPVVGIIGVDNFKDVTFEITDDFRTGFKDYIDRFKLNYVEMADTFARENIRTNRRDVINRIVKDYKNADPRIALEIMTNFAPKFANEKVALQTLPFKLRIIASDYEPYNEKALSQYCRNGYSIYWINSAGHFPMVEQPEQFAAALTNALSDIRQNK